MNKKPTILCVTNYVAMDMTANTLLAIGAVPIMSSYIEEMDELVSKCDAVSVNIGCVDADQLEAMLVAVKAAHRYSKPWVLDPVGYGFSKKRTEACRQLVEVNSPAIIRGNKRELTDEDNCKAIAMRTGSVVAMTGDVDYLTDGLEDFRIYGGDAMMDRVTAVGCSLSAVCAAFAAFNNDYIQATYNALNLYSKAGELAALKSDGPGSFRMNFIDCLANMHLI